MSDAVPVFLSPSPRIRRVSVDRPWVWLAKGWDDIRRARGASLAYGIAIVAASYLVVAALAWFESIYALLPLAAGFMFLAPLLAAGLYDTSRRLAAGETPDFGTTAKALGRNPEHLAYMGLVLMVFNLFWTRVALLLFALFFGTPRNTVRELIDLTLFSPDSVPFLMVGTAIGAVLSALVFAISAVSIPMLLDRPTCSVWTAIATSFVAVRENWKPMALWAALIVAFTAFGMVPFFLGLVVTLPLIGHATWHAYKDLVVDGES
jgi:uncharacterized membrane protein